MKVFLCFVALLSVVACSVLPDVKLRNHFRNLGTIRHPLYNKGENWLKARGYISLKMEQLGITNMTLQNFNTSVTSVGEEMKYATGVNIIGLMKGIIRYGPVIVIGADYDTPIAGDPYKNNAGGVATLLETIHLFQDRIRWNPNTLDHTVIFVAFDLNTKEYSTAGAGKSGSYHFVHDWLPKFLAEYDATLAGAIILDSVTTYYRKNHTQQLITGFEDAFPDAYSKIVSNGKKGDFLGLVSTMNQTTNRVRTTFINNFNKEKIKRPYYLQEMPLHKPLELVTNNISDLVNHQAQYHFWTYTENKFPAFLLFDTDESRSNSDDNSCPSNDCSATKFLTKDRTDFMTKIVHTLLQTLMDLQTEKYEIPNGSPSDNPAPLIAFFTVLISLVVAQLLKAQH